MTIAMLSLAGVPATAGFIGKFYLIDAAVSGDYTWLGIVIVVGVGDVVRLLPARGRGDVDGPLRGASCRRIPPRRVQPVAGWSPEADALRPARGRRDRRDLFAAATIFFGLVPEPAVRRRARRGQRFPGLL